MWRILEKRSSNCEKKKELHLEILLNKQGLIIQASAESKMEFFLLQTMKRSINWQRLLTLMLTNLFCLLVEFLKTSRKSSYVTIFF